MQNVQNNNNIRTEEVNESYDTISVDDLDIEVLQKPDSGSYSCLLYTSGQVQKGVDQFNLTDKDIVVRCV